MSDAVAPAPPPPPHTLDYAPPSFSAHERPFAGIILAVILLTSFIIKLNHLGHASIKGFDESFHALVAKNLLKHPFTPTLIDRPYLSYDYKDWQNNHVWLHKPIVPLWQMAASMAVFGVNTLAMRLPSAVLSTAAVWLTYAIALRLLDRRAALIAAALHAFNPALTYLVHGYVFSDHVDVALLFWVELSIYFLVRAIDTTSIGWTIAAGIAQGVAFLCKTYPAFVITGIAVVAALLPLAGFANPKRFRARHLLILVAVTIVTIAPWTIWCLIKFRQEFVWEQLQIFRHLDQNVEGWAAPWDRLVFDYSLRIYHVFYPAVIAASIVLIPRAWREKSFKLALIYAWGFGVLLPHVLATSKTPTATLIGWPPFLMLLAAMIVRAIDGDIYCLGAWAGATVSGIVYRGIISSSGWGYPSVPGFARIMRDNIWVVWHALIALAAAAALVELRPSRRLRVAVVALACFASVWMTYRLVRLSIASTNKTDRDKPTFAELGSAVRTQLPPDAVLLLEIRQKAEHVMAMFYTDRTVYPVDPQMWPAIARQVAGNGGIPLLVTDRELTLPAVFDRPLDGLHVYAVGQTATTR
jgi:4-amino-4-deoxy-L-arabinose transferase